MTEVPANTQLDLQAAQFVAEQTKPFIDAEVSASPAIKRAAQEMTSHAMNDAENTYEQTKDFITDPVKAETLAYRAKPAIDIAAESGKALREAREKVSEKIHLVPDDAAPPREYEEVQEAESVAYDKASKDARVANQVVDVLDKSYDTPEGK